jgi:ABC-2 type transport system permease protein
VIGGPGSTLWLLRHELRLDWRRRTQRRGGRLAAVTVTLGVPLFLMAFVGFPLGRALRHIDQPSGSAPVMLAALALTALFTLMLSQALAAVVEALYQRGDLDLMFSSPIPPRRVVAIRALAIAFQAFSVFGYFTAGPLIVVALMGHPRWIAGLGVLFALALAATGVALILAAGLFRLFGARRTRTLAHLTAALIGALLFLATQVVGLVGGDASRSLFAKAAELARAPGFQPPAGLAWGLGALTGQPAPLAAAVGLGAGVFLACSLLLAPRFAADAAAAAGADSGPRRKGAPIRPFVGGAFRATLRKELRLIFRDPMLVAQVLVRVLYMLPLGLLAVRQGAGHQLALPGAVAALVLMTNQVAGSLAWIAISAEDAPDLLATAPARPSLVVRGKLAAVALAVAVLLSPVLPPLIAVAPLAGLAAALGCAAAVASATLVNLWWQRPVKRTEFRNRRNTSWFVSLAELGLGLLIATAAGLVATGQAWPALAPAALAAAILLALRRPPAQVGALQVEERSGAA